jgi:hypothetical protein
VDQPNEISVSDLDTTVGAGIVAGAEAANAGELASENSDTPIEFPALVLKIYVLPVCKPVASALVPVA